MYQYQAEDRIHRIDHQHQTHHTVEYCRLLSQYPTQFLEDMKQCWVRKESDGTYTEVRSKRIAEKENLPTAYEEFFAQGTWDEVQDYNLSVQKEVFHLINDGIGDESLLTEHQKKFKGIDESNGGNNDSEDEERED